MSKKMIVGLIVIFLGSCLLTTTCLMAAEERGMSAHKLRMTEDCYAALELDIAVPFRCAQYMTTGEIK